jgi:hypothetical protein
LTELAVLLLFREQLSPTAWLAAFLGGLGLVFALMYLLRERDTRWAAIPAGALILVAITTLATTAPANLQFVQFVTRFWPILLIVGGLGLLIGTLGRGAVQPPEAASKPPTTTTKTAPVKGKTGAPKAALPKPAASQEPALVSVSGAPVEEKPIDIYELLKQQPPETAPETTAAPKPPPDEPAK